MCGIVGYIGDQPALPIILGGLERLEYRGYDSAGVAVVESGELVVHRALGKLFELRKVVEKTEAGKEGVLGIGHTRWATHGKPSENNAHPHSVGRISLIHNGIIENYTELREELRAEGVQFSSETDTEIAAHLLNKMLSEIDDPFEALKKTCQRLRGSYAFLAIDVERPDRILIAKNSTPIVVGFSENSAFIGSDIPAILPYTRDIIVLEDGDIAEVRVNSVKIENEGKTVERKTQRITWDPITAQKGGFKHYMLKEIYEQEVVLGETFRGRLRVDDQKVQFADFPFDEQRVKEIDRMVLAACGTAWHACLVGKYWIEKLAGIPCEVDYASEFRYRAPVLSNKSLFAVVSQSGETADTLAALETASAHCDTLAVCNVLGSSIARRAGHVIFTQAGPEISVASTKAFTTQLVALYLLAIYLGEKRGHLSVEDRALAVEQLFLLPALVGETLQSTRPKVEEAAKRYYGSRDMLYLGRGICYPIALEGALKLKEISYIHAEGYPAGEMKHGPIALIDSNMPVIVVLQRDSLLFEKSLSNLREAHSREGRIIAITDSERGKELSEVCEEVIEVPFLSDLLSPILLTIPLQLFAYDVAVLNGTDVDLPRNLAKSVTVE